MTRLTRRSLLALGAGVPFLAVLPAAAADDPRLAEMVLGSADAPVEIIEYASLTCPHCARFHVDVLPKLKDAYIDTGKVRLLFREVYFDRFGLWATMIARCEPLRYFGVVNEVFRTQQDWRAGPNDAAVAENLRRIGTLANLSDDRMNACMADQDFANALVRIYQDHARRDGIDSTPTFLVNGEKHGNMSFEEFSALIDAKLN
jgi:protein-disulfide isomerase